MSNKKEKTVTYSEKISDFCNFMQDVQEEYLWNYKSVGKMDELTQDYLHDLELRGLNYAERAKIATKLADVRRKRRECKDIVATLEPLVDFLESEKGFQLINLTKEVLGKTRKIEEKMKFRVYVPRVSEEEPIVNAKTKNVCV